MSEDIFEQQDEPEPTAPETDESESQEETQEGSQEVDEIAEYQAKKAKFQENLDEMFPDAQERAPGPWGAAASLALDGPGGANAEDTADRLDAKDGADGVDHEKMEEDARELRDAYEALSEEDKMVVDIQEMENGEGFWERQGIEEDQIRACTEDLESEREQLQTLLGPGADLEDPFETDTRMDDLNESDSAASDRAKQHVNRIRELEEELSDLRENAKNRVEDERRNLDGSG